MNAYAIDELTAKLIFDSPEDEALFKERLRAVAPLVAARAIRQAADDMDRDMSWPNDPPEWLRARADEQVNR